MAARRPREAFPRSIQAARWIAETKTGAFVFPDQKSDKPLSLMAMAMVLRRIGIKSGEATVHGFRATFKSWAYDESHFSREIVEAALAHVVGDKAEQSYRRSDALEKRRELMAAWANHCEPATDSNVAKLARPRA